MTPTEANAMLDEFATLEANWDSYDADPIAALAISTARRLIVDRPRHLYHVCPAPDGGVIAEWRNFPIALEVWIDDAGECSLLMIESRSGGAEEYEETETVPYGRVLKYINRKIGV